jgi:hypothetical protein
MVPKKIEQKPKKLSEKKKNAPYPILIFRSRACIGKPF